MSNFTARRPAYLIIIVVFAVPAKNSRKSTSCNM